MEVQLSLNTVLLHLKRAISLASPVHLREFYLEIYPAAPAPVIDQNTRTYFVTRLRHALKQLELEELVALWKVVYPTHRRVRFEDDLFTFEASNGQISNSGDSL